MSKKIQRYDNLEKGNGGKRISEKYWEKVSSGGNLYTTYVSETVPYCKCFTDHSANGIFHGSVFQRLRVCQKNRWRQLNFSHEHRSFYYSNFTVSSWHYAKYVFAAHQFLANVNSCSCSLYVVVRPSVCRLSSVVCRLSSVCCLSSVVCL